MNDPNENREGYKETKVGWIPEEWRCTQLVKIAQLESGHTPARDRDDYWNGKIGWVSLHDTDNLDGREINSTVRTVSTEGIKNSSARILPEGTVVFSRTATVGKTTTLGSPMATSQDFANFVCGEEIQNHYLVHLFRNMTTVWRRLMSGSTHKTVYMPEFKRLNIPVPPPLEQKKITEILANCDEAIEKTSSLINAKKRQKNALMQQLLTGKKRLPGFDEEWVSRKMSSVLTHVFRPVEWAGDKIFHLVSVRRRSMGLFRREPLRGDQYKTKDLHELKSGDFLISKRQVTHGALAMITDEFDGCHVSKEYSIFINKSPKKLHMPFFNWLSRTRRMWWFAYVASNGVVIEKLIFVPQDFLKFEILLPPTVKEQAAISKVLDTCDAELAALEKKLAAFKQQKKALMQKLLTGQVRVKTK